MVAMGISLTHQLTESNDLWHGMVAVLLRRLVNTMVTLILVSTSELSLSSLRIPRWHGIRALTLADPSFL